MSHDVFTKFIEDNYDWLIEGFIKKYQKEWDDFTFNEYENRPEPPDYDPAEDL